MATGIVTLPPLARLSKIEQFPRSLLGYAFRVQITIKLVADVLEVRCAHCQRLLDMHSNRRDAYFPAGDFLDHVCAAASQRFRNGSTRRSGGERVIMPCAEHQSLFDSDRRIWEAWKGLIDKKNRSVSETEETHRLAKAGGDSSQAIKEHTSACFECSKAGDITAR